MTESTYSPASSTPIWTTSKEFDVEDVWTTSKGFDIQDVILVKDRETQAWSYSATGQFKADTLTDLHGKSGLGLRRYVIIIHITGY